MDYPPFPRDAYLKMIEHRKMNLLEEVSLPIERVMEISQAYTDFDKWWDAVDRIKENMEKNNE